MSKKKSIGIILLLVFLIWSLFNTLFRIFIRNDSTDATLWKTYNLLWIGSFLALIILCLNITSIFVMFKPKKWGIKVLYAFFILNMVINIFTLSLSMLNIDLLKDAAIESRTSRGLSTEGIDFIVNPLIILISITFYLGFYISLIFYVNKRQDYFFT